MAAVRGLISLLKDPGKDASETLTFVRSKRMSKASLCKARAAFGGREDLSDKDTSIETMVDELLSLARSQSDHPPSESEAEPILQPTEHETVSLSCPLQGQVEQSGLGQDDSLHPTGAPDAQTATLAEVSTHVPEMEANCSQTQPTPKQDAPAQTCHPAYPSDLASLVLIIGEMKDAFVRESSEARDGAVRMQTKVSELTSEVKALSEALEQTRREAAERERGLLKKLHDLSSQINSNNKQRATGSSDKKPRKRGDKAQHSSEKPTTAPTLSTTTDTTRSDDWHEEHGDWSASAPYEYDDEVESHEHAHPPFNTASNQSATGKLDSAYDDTTSAGKHPHRAAETAGARHHHQPYHFAPLTPDDNTWQLVTKVRPSPPRAARAVIFAGNISEDATDEGITEFIRARSLAVLPDSDPPTVHKISMYKSKEEGNALGFARITVNASDVGRLLCNSFWPQAK